MMASRWLWPLVIGLLTVVCYHNAVWCGFVFDDASAIKDNKDLLPNRPISNLFWNDFWGTPMDQERSHKSYRPICVLTFRWNYAWTELEPWSFHLVNIILHGIVCLLFLRVTQLFASEFVSVLSTLLFAVHPIHTEAVTGVVGRAELLAAIFSLMALYHYSQAGLKSSGINLGRLLFVEVLVVIATLCKEQGITVVAVCAVYDVFIAQKATFAELIGVVKSLVRGKPQIPGRLVGSIKRAVLLVSCTVVLLTARIKVMGAQLPVFTRFDNPASVASSPARQLTFTHLLQINTWLLLCPSWLCCDWTMGTIPLIQSLLDVRNLGTLIFIIGMTKIVLYVMQNNGPRCRTTIMSLALTVFPFLPASNLFFPVGFVVAERILYAPSMGLSLITALGCETIVGHKRKLKTLMYFCMAGLIVLHSAKTIVRNYDWESEYTLFKAALRVNQQNAKLWNNVGHALEGEDRYDEALDYFQQAARVQPDDIGAHINVGRTLKHLGLNTEAETAYRKALALLPPVRPGKSYTARVAPNHLNVFINLGNLISKNESRLLEADALYRTAISMRTDFTQAYINRGDILMKLNRPLDAQESYEKALNFEGDNPDIYYNLGVVHLEQQKATEALINFNKALQLKPDHKQSLFNSAVLIQESNIAKLRPDAYKRLHKLLLQEPENEKAYFNLGMLAMDDKQYQKAYTWFKKAIELKPDFRSALFNLALMLVNDMKLPGDAVPVLDQLLKHYPNHTKGLILMGDVNINHLKNVEAAEKNFRKILENEPHNVQAVHNLCVCHVERGHLLEAEACLVRALQLAPKEEYIQNHLYIVRNRIHKAKQSMAKQNKEKKEMPVKTEEENP